MEEGLNEDLMKERLRRNKCPASVQILNRFCLFVLAAQLLSGTAPASRNGWPGRDGFGLYLNQRREE